ncbi:MULTISPECIES: SDR family oxidoreductase [Nostocales]|uniref:NmrA family transcriptional regulator n=3 Tax=Nostocales TaxID=1161 RepID=A0A0C1NGX4_9CYAN|nr:SDR family oxidoreductase [Tolypothrix bouteillei]KAF3890620.1 SDR family oxidoreductase [Tolypothrix bouteillei VB521301]
MLTILVTGATGNVGQEVIRLLLNQNCQVRAAIRNSDTATEILSVRSTAGFSGHSIDGVPFDFTNPATFATAFQGVDKLFLVRPPNLANVRKQIAPALDAVKLAGIKQVVFLSILGADRNPIVPHSKIERYINLLGIPATFLRASFFMQNLNTTHQEDIKTRGELFLPAGHGKTSFIDVRDIAAVAVRTLMEEGHSQKAYTLTGGEALTYYEVADIFTDVLGKPIHYTNPSIWNFIQRMRDRGLPMDFIMVMVGIYTTARLGLAGHLTPDVEQLLARPPITMQQYVEDYRQFWL